MAEPEFSLFWRLLGRLVVYLRGQRAHAEIVLTLRDGVVQTVRVNQTFMPENIPKV